MVAGLAVIVAYRVLWVRARTVGSLRRVASYSFAHPFVAQGDFRCVADRYSVARWHEGGGYRSTSGLKRNVNEPMLAHGQARS